MSRHRVTASVLNARSGPGVQSPILTRLPSGTEVERLEEAPSGGWSRVRVRLRDGEVEAWVASRYLEPASPAGADLARTLQVPWLRIASGEIGVREYPGAADNPRIVEYHSTTTLRATDDEVHWCSSFVNWTVDRAGLRGTRSAAARSWLRWGEPLAEPRPGCIVVFRRGRSPTSGHVGFFLRSRGIVVEVLGGNQSNQVKVSSYPTRDVLGYRWPAGEGGGTS